MKLYNLPKKITDFDINSVHENSYPFISNILGNLIEFKKLTSLNLSKNILYNDTMKQLCEIL